MTLKDLGRPRQLRAPSSPRGFVLLASLTFIALMLGWETLTAMGLVGPLFLPSPWAVIQAVFHSLVDDHWALDILVSCYRIAMSFVLSAALAVPTGILIGTYRWAEALFEPINDFIRYMPVVAFIPLCILWLGTGDLEKVAVVFIGTYFQLVLLVAGEASRVHREYLETYLLLGGTNLGCLRQVVLPATWPEIFDSLRISAGWAWSYLVVAELVDSDRGIGFKILQSQRFLQTPKVIGGIIIVGLLGLLTDLLFKRLARRIFLWT